MTSTERTRMILVGTVAPLTIALLGVITMLWALPNLPNPIATHWGPSGQVNGSGPAWMMLLLPVVVVGGYTAFSLAFTRHTAVFTDSQRMILAIAPFLAVVMTVGIAGSVVMQRGLESAADAPSAGPLVAVGFAGGIIVGVLAWFTLPKSQAPTPVDMSTAPVLDLAATERAVWMHHLEPSRWLGLFAIGILGLAIVGGAVALWTTVPVAACVLYVVVMLAIAALSVGTLFWRVRVDENGFSAISVLGIPRFVIPLAEVAAAAPVEVVAVRDFGGWGIRWAGRGRVGVILRGGEAIEVRRTNGKSFVVTVNNAAEGAALLNALKARVVT